MSIVSTRAELRFIIFIIFFIFFVFFLNILVLVMCSSVVTGASQNPCRDMKFSRIDPNIVNSFPCRYYWGVGVTKSRDMYRYKITRECENWDSPPHIQLIHSVAITNSGIKEWKWGTLVIARSIAKLGRHFSISVGPMPPQEKNQIRLYKLLGSIWSIV